MALLFSAAKLCRLLWLECDRRRHFGQQRLV